MATVNLNYPAGTATITISPASVASSSTFVAGRQSTAINNVTNLDLDNLISGTWTAGTTPTTNTQVQIWVVAAFTDNLSGTIAWPDTFGASDAAVTATSAGCLQGEARLAAVLNVDSATSNRTYYCASFSVAALFGGDLPTNYVIWITHNTVAAANATGGNFVWQYQRIRATVA